MSIEALKLALEALESKDTWGSSVRVLKERAVTSLRTALSASKIEGDLIQRFYEGEEAKSLISEAEETITALREALAEQPAQPEQEPVAWGMMNDDGKIYDCICPEEHDRVEGEYTIPLYTSPPQRTWQGLTLADKREFTQQDFGGSRLDAMDWAEQRLKEKNA